jgi:hypothetical protein
MMENSGYATFCLYNALKLHFTSSYDYFKYNGKTNVSQNTFLTRKDKYTFYRLSRKYNLEELRDYLVSNFVYGEAKWVGDMTGPDGEDCYKKWQKNMQSLTYRFENDIVGILNEVDSPEEWLRVKDGQYPMLLNEVLQGTIQLETLVIMNDIMGFFPMWEKRIEDDVVFPTLIMKYKKYQPFLSYDRPKFKNILKEKILDHA